MLRTAVSDVASGRWWVTLGRKFRATVSGWLSPATAACGGRKSHWKTTGICSVFTGFPDAAPTLHDGFSQRQLRLEPGQKGSNTSVESPLVVSDGDDGLWWPERSSKLRVRCSVFHTVSLPPSFVSHGDSRLLGVSQTAPVDPVESGMMTHDGGGDERQRRCLFEASRSLKLTFSSLVSTFFLCLTLSLTQLSHEVLSLFHAAASYLFLSRGPFYLASLLFNLASLLLSQPPPLWLSLLFYLYF